GRNGQAGPPLSRRAAGPSAGDIVPGARGGSGDAPGSSSAPGGAGTRRRAPRRGPGGAAPPLPLLRRAVLPRGFLTGSVRPRQRPIAGTFSADRAGPAARNRPDRYTEPRPGPPRHRRPWRRTGIPRP